MFEAPILRLSVCIYLNLIHTIMNFVCPRVNLSSQHCVLSLHFGTQIMAWGILSKS